MLGLCWVCNEKNSCDVLLQNDEQQQNMFLIQEIFIIII